MVEKERTIMRANKITVVANGDNYRATFKKTHKLIADIHSELTEWKAPDNANKTLQRESFRQWAIEHAGDYNIEYKPEDMRAEGQVRVAQYTNDDVLKSDVVALMVDDMKNLTANCKYAGWKGMEVDDITPKTHTGKGTDLTRLGIHDGKYKSGNWAWADISCMATVQYDKNEVYVPFMVELVSGQLRKPKITKTHWAELIANEIIGAGLATMDELNPPKDKNKAQEVEVIEEPVEEPVVELESETQGEEDAVKILTEEEIRKIRKKDVLVEYAHSIGIAVTDIKMKDLKEKVIRHMQSRNLAKAE